MLSENIIQSIRSNIPVEDKILKFKKWNFGTSFYPCITSIESYPRVRVVYKNLSHMLQWKKGILYPDGLEMQIDLFLNTLELNKKYIITNTTNNNFDNVHNILMTILDKSMSPNTNYELNQLHNLDIFFYICISAEFYNQVDKNPELKSILYPQKFEENYLVDLIKKIICLCE